MRVPVETSATHSRARGVGVSRAGHDQPALNYVFKDWRYIKKRDWMAATPGRAARHCEALEALGDRYDAYAAAESSDRGFSEKTTRACQRAADIVEDAFLSSGRRRYHFFSGAVPWCAATTEGCAAVAPCAGKKRAGPSRCVGHDAALKTWWAALDRLPPAARDACRASLSGKEPDCVL